MFAVQVQEEKTAAKAVVEQGSAREEEENLKVEDIRVKQKLSDVWCHFEAPKLYNGHKKAKCKVCEKLISAVNTTNLRSHMNSLHKDVVTASLLASDKVT